MKRPESVLVLVYNQDAEVLVLERCQPRGFFQSVTGSLEWGESAPAAAARELEEETGLSPVPAPRDCHLDAYFEIHPAWRDRFPPGTQQNHERVFCRAVQGRPAIRLNPEEHVSWQWMPFDRALAKVSSHSNRQALCQVIPLRMR
nr:dihydroneopterin triphosphate diphosphatase [Natronospira proteinivora]